MLVIDPTHCTRCTGPQLRIIISWACTNGAFLAIEVWLIKWAVNAYSLVDVIDHARWTVQAFFQAEIKVLGNETLNTVHIIPEFVNWALTELRLLVKDSAA